MPHFSEFDSFSKAFVGFSNYARDKGLEVGLSETAEAMHTVFLGLWKDTVFFRYALACIFCNKEEDRVVFEEIFSCFWGQKKTELKYRARFKNRSNLQKNTKGNLVMLGQQAGTEPKDHRTKTTSGANSQEALRKTDFALMNQVDEVLLDALCEQLVREMKLRIKRKNKRGKQGQIDMVRTVRHGISLGGNFFKVYQKEKKKEKLRLVLILDVSGSMDKYSIYLLKFIWVLRKYFSHMEAFTFSTRLKRITESLNQKSIYLTLTSLGHEADHWSSGTKIGECLKDFIESYGRRVLNGRTMTIILSDGLDTGEPFLLQQQLERIRMKTKKLIWLNPLKGSESYQPIQRGMQVALPYLDVFQSAHNLESLLILENIIAHA